MPSILVYFKMQCISIVTKLNFQQSLLQSSESHDPSETILISWFCAQEKYNFLCLYTYIQKNRQNSIYLKYIIPNNINVFTVSLDQFKAFFMKSINFFTKKKEVAQTTENSFLVWIDMEWPSSHFKIKVLFPQIDFNTLL